jgi:hypothetical protein
MDKVTLHKLKNRPNILKDHNLKYLEFKVTIPMRVGKLREIVQSLPHGDRRTQGIEIIDYILESFNEVSKDYDALQEGSQARNLISDMVGYIELKDAEARTMIDLVNSLTKQLRGHDKR